MTIAKDAFSQIGSGTGTVSGTHTTAASPKGVFVCIHQYIGATDEVTGVTYGGQTMTEVSPSPVLHATGETGAVYMYFLGSGIPSGNQTVEVSVNATGSTKAVSCLSVTAAANTEIVDSDGGAADSSNGPSFALSFGGRSCFVILQGLSGEDTVGDTSPAAGWTFDAEGDAGTNIAIVATYDTVGTSDVTASWVQTSNDHTAIAAAIAEVTGTTTKSYVRTARAMTLGLQRHTMRKS